MENKLLDASQNNIYNKSQDTMHTDSIAEVSDLQPNYLVRIQEMTERSDSNIDEMYEG